MLISTYSPPGDRSSRSRGAAREVPQGAVVDQSEQPAQHRVRPEGARGRRQRRHLRHAAARPLPPASGAPGGAYRYVTI